MEQQSVSCVGHSATSLPVVAAFGGSSAAVAVVAIRWRLLGVAKLTSGMATLADVEHGELNPPSESATGKALQSVHTDSCKHTGVATFAALTAALRAVHYGQLSHRVSLPILALWLVGRGKGVRGILGPVPTPPDASVRIPAIPLLPSTFGAIFQWFLYYALCLPFRSAGMEPKLLRSMLTSRASTSRLAVELFLMIQSNSEDSDDDINSSNAYVKVPPPL
ncbi:hypothetical protein UY3_13339 [Chelonia mydas]|uniref:Uncharacterized protein n=1 Tax=Chelonia mydas TaxID=8469 RepID=M7AXN9_CHEMY|nr:hypothetical protein UY3_13339 [Chelonia mydas]